MELQKFTWSGLISMLPDLLDKNGKYIYFGDEPDCTPYSICRVELGWRDCSVISDNGEDSTAIVLECSHTTSGYLGDIEDWLWQTLGLSFDEPVYICASVMGEN